MRNRYSVTVKYISIPSFLYTSGCVNPSPEDKILRPVQIETNCRRQFKVHFEKGRKHCKKKEKLLVTSNFCFLTMFSQLYIFSASKCGIMWYGLNILGFLAASSWFFLEHPGCSRHCQGFFSVD